MTTKHHNAETKSLIGQLTRLTDRTADTIKEAASILQELKARKLRHPLMRDGVLLYYAEIASDQLSARAALAFAGVHTILKRIVSLPLAQQDSLADGKEISIAVHNSKGEIINENRTLIQLTAAQLDMALAAGSVRSFTEQKKILAARRPRARRSRSPIKIRADAASGEIICGQLRFKPNDLAAAMKILGFKIIREAA